MRTTIIIFLASLFNSLCFYINAQNADFNFAKQIGSVDNDAAYAVTTDAAGNIYVAGKFSSTADFDPGAGTTNMASFGMTDAFVAKFGPNGNLIFARQIGGTNDDWAESIALDKNGNIIVTGKFIGTCDFDPSGTSYNLSSNGGTQEDAFFLKLDPAGSLLWAKQIGGTQPDYTYGIAIDGANNYLFTGRFTGTVDFDPGPSTSNLSATVNQCFILKLSSSGNYIWAKTFDSPISSSSLGGSIVTDAFDNVITTGYFIGTADFDPSGAINNVTVAGQKDIFISKLSSSGDFVFVKTFSGTADEAATSVKVDYNGNIYTTGYFQGTVDFDPSGSAYQLTCVSPSTYGNIFVAKLDQQGNFKWAKQFEGATSSDVAYTIDLDNQANVYIAGMFNGTTDFDPGAATFNITSLNGDNDIFVSKLDSSGNFVWAKAMQGTIDDKAHSIAIDNFGGIVSVGSFTGTVDFDPGTTSFNLTDIGATSLTDIFISKLSCSAPQITITNTNDASCSGGNNGSIELSVTGGNPPYQYNWSPINNNTSNPTGLYAGTYTCTVFDSDMCSADTIITLAEPTPITLTLSTTNSTCNDNTGTALVNASGGNINDTIVFSNNTNIVIPNNTTSGINSNIVSTGISNTTITTGMLQSICFTINHSKHDDIGRGPTTDAVQITVNGNTYNFTPLPLGSASGTATYCFPQSILNSIMAAGGNSNTTWTFHIEDNRGAGGGTGSLVSWSVNFFNLAASYTYLWSSGSNQALADTLYPGQYSVQVFDANGCSTSGIANINASDGPSLTLSSSTNVTCNGSNNGALGVSVSGGTGPYTYDWTTGDSTANANNLYAGQYDLSVTDANGCSASATYNVTQPNALSVSFVTGALNCGANDGTITSNVSGGTGPYTYLWSANAASQTTAVASNLSAGIYTLTVTDAMGCSKTGVASLSTSGGNINIVVNSVTPASCGASPTGSIQITTTGGTSPYTYQWNNGATTEDISGLVPGHYVVNATDANGCVGSAFANVSSALSGANQQICIVTVDTTTLTNQVAWEKTQGNGIKSYKVYREAAANSYLPIATVPFANLSEYTDATANPSIRSWRYKIAAIDSCDVETPISNPHKTIHLVQYAALGGANSLMWDFYDGYTYDYFYIWRHDPSTSWELIDSLPSNLTSYTDLTPPSTDSRYMIEIRPPAPCNTTMRLANGAYDVQGTIVKSKSNIRTNSVVGIKESKNKDKVKSKVYPNPTKDLLNVEIFMKQGEEATIEIENMLGQVIFTKQTFLVKTTINTSNIKTGVYFVRVKTTKGSSVEKVVIE